jgi:hypothetical protein
MTAPRLEIPLPISGKAKRSGEVAAPAKEDYKQKDQENQSY